ncbi:hypothetical protein Pfo_001275 [Paulownia fortunei]|nr:hypothetical protein Pfo_001275 [Paulownia fortunei]
MQILSWEFCARQVEVDVPPFQPTTPLIYASVGGLYAGFQDYMTQRKRDMRSHINHFGLPLSYCSCFEIIKTLDTMKDLMFFSIQHKLEPISTVQLSHFC